MIRALGLILALALASSASGADGASLALSPTAAAPESAAWSDHGLEVGFRLSALSVFNAAPLAHGPVDLGWRFSNGLRLRTGLNLFYYEGKDRDPKEPKLGVETYTYEMLNWRSSLEYVVPLPLRIRPVAGLSLDLITGSRQRVVSTALTAPPKIAAWSALAPGALLGLDFRAGPSYALGLQGRYSSGFSETGSVVAVDMTWHYLF